MAGGAGCARATPRRAASSPVAAVTLSWAPPTHNVDGSLVAAPLTFNLYQGLAAAGIAAPALVQRGLTSPKTTASGLIQGKWYFFQVSAVANGQEGPLSVVMGLLIPMDPVFADPWDWGEEAPDELFVDDFGNDDLAAVPLAPGTPVVVSIN